MNYLDLVEEHNGQSKINLFEKVKIIANRSRDLYSGKTSKAVSKEDIERRKPITIAHYEMVKGYIEPNIFEKEEKVDDYMDIPEID
ncbi:DNA-directed RNA polymerase subunit omega [bacterium]|nr:DNA-directed RNA polymerase subunit omega [bacterium]